MAKKIVFMGTPDFAVASLSKLISEGIEVAAVVTAPDRPAGRGQKLQESAVKKFAVLNEIPVLQPEKLKAEDFINSLKSIGADLFVVVAFRMLPEVVWQMPPLGTINLHGSLLPKYRGAAPINWAVINGDKETGVTTFFIEKQIDTGQIIGSAKISIRKEDTAGTIHDQLMHVGANLLKDTVVSIFNGTATKKPQPDEEATHAPKIFKPDCKIDWKKDVKTIFNKIRGLSPYPTAFTTLENDKTTKSLKIFKVDFDVDHKNNEGKIKSENEFLCIGASNGWIIIHELQLEGKKRMQSADFLKGFNIEEWQAV